MKIICFELTMPNVGSWDGHWTQEEEKHLIFKHVSDKFFKENEKKLVGSWYYNFGDGWGALVSGSVIDSKERQKLSKINRGFCGYGWMVQSIMLVGGIYTDKELKEILANEEGTNNA